MCTCPPDHVLVRGVDVLCPAPPRGSFVKNGCSSACAGVSRLSGSTTKVSARGRARPAGISRTSSTVRRYAFSGSNPHRQPAARLFPSRLLNPLLLAVRRLFRPRLERAVLELDSLRQLLRVGAAAQQKILELLPRSSPVRWAKSNSATIPGGPRVGAAPSYALAPNRSSGACTTASPRGRQRFHPRGSLLAKPKSASFRVPSS